MALFGWGLSEVIVIRIVAALAIPALAMLLWGTFAVPDDRSRSGKAPIPIPGPLRLALEITFFGFSSFCLLYNSNEALSLVFGGLVVLHYGLSIERIKWLLNDPENS